MPPNLHAYKFPIFASGSVFFFFCLPLRQTRYMTQYWPINWKPLKTYFSLLSFSSPESEKASASSSFSHQWQPWIFCGLPAPISIRQSLLSGPEWHTQPSRGSRSQNCDPKRPWTNTKQSDQWSNSRHSKREWKTCRLSLRAVIQNIKFLTFTIVL